MMTLFHYLYDKLYPIMRFLYEKVFGNAWYAPIHPNLWLGGALTYRRDYDFLLREGFTAVVDIRAEREDDLALYTQYDIAHVKFKVPEGYIPPLHSIDLGVKFIREHMQNGGKVYVHCAKGRTRSATLVAGYLMKYHNMTFEEARQFLEGKRPLVSLNERYGRALNTWVQSEEIVEEPVALQPA